MAFHEDRRKQTSVEAENHGRRVGNTEVLQRQEHSGVPTGRQHGRVGRQRSAVRRGGVVHAADERHNRLQSRVRYVRLLY